MALGAGLRDALMAYRENILMTAAIIPSEQLPAGTTRLRNALDGAIAALDSVSQAEASAAASLADPMLSMQGKLDQADRLRSSASQQAKAALSDLGDVKDSIAARFVSVWQPKRPAGVSDTAFDRRIVDLQTLLTASGADAGSILSAATQLLRESLADGSDDALLTAHVLSAGPLAIYYRTHQVTPAMQAGAFSAVAGSKGGRLAALLGTEGQQDTLSSFIAMASKAIDMALADMRKLANQYAEVWATSGGQVGSMTPMSASLQAQINQRPSALPNLSPSLRRALAASQAQGIVNPNGQPD
jgi:hypothetical protein